MQKQNHNSAQSSPIPIESRESGQIMVSLLLMLTLFLLATIGFAVDFTNLWFHRQAAQTAADSACQAGASDLYLAIYNASSGLSAPNMGFTVGTSGDCSMNSGAGSICFYANANGYNGTGLSSGVSNSVAWTFPASVNGVTAPPTSITSNPFLKVTVTENVKTYFLSTLRGAAYQKVSASCTCGLLQEPKAAPVMVLNPNASGAFSLTGGGRLSIVGGPQRGLLVNSNSSTAISCSPSGIIDTSLGGPSDTGSDVAVAGGPTSAPTTCYGGGFKGGSTGSWYGSVLPIVDPYAGVAAPTSVKSIVPTSGLNGTSVQKAQSMSVAGQDGCPDTKNPCIEFSPGYYPNGITTGNYQTYIFLPGIYYMGGSLTAGHSATVRMATPCTPSCSPLSSNVGQQTDGLMFYFSSGSINLSGCSGCASASIIPVPSTALTCDGSTPNSGLGMPSSINGNVLIAQCATNGTYWDTGGDTTDSRGNPGSRGLLIYQAHDNTASVSYGGSGSLAFSGSLYLHSTSFSDVLNISGGASSGTYILGQIVADEINLSGSGAINLALNPAKSTELLKISMLQ